MSITVKTRASRVDQVRAITVKTTANGLRNVAAAWAKTDAQSSELFFLGDLTHQSVLTHGSYLYTYGAARQPIYDHSGSPFPTMGAMAPWLYVPDGRLVHLLFSFVPAENKFSVLVQIESQGGARQKSALRNLSWQGRNTVGRLSGEQMSYAVQDQQMAWKYDEVSVEVPDWYPDFTSPTLNVGASFSG